MLKRLWNWITRTEPPSAAAVRSSAGLKDDYEIAAHQLRILKLAIDEWLRRGHERRYHDMKQVSPGIWIHKDYKDLSEALAFLNSLIPKSSNSEISHNR